MHVRSHTSRIASNGIAESCPASELRKESGHISGTKLVIIAYGCREDLKAFQRSRVGLGTPMYHETRRY